MKLSKKTIIERIALKTLFTSPFLNTQWPPAWMNGQPFLRPAASYLPNSKVSVTFVIPSEPFPEVTPAIELLFLDSTLRIGLRRDDERSFGGEFVFLKMSERFHMGVTMTLVTVSREDSSEGIYEVSPDNRHFHIPSQSISDVDYPVLSVKFDFSIRPGLYAGLHNPGRLCYLNCAIQCLFHLPVVRKYAIETPGPTEEACALRRLFRSMELSSYCETTDLTAAFGWVPQDHHFRQQGDVDEIWNRLIGSFDSQALLDLFEGRCDLRMTFMTPGTDPRVRHDTFSSIPIRVAGYRDLIHSFSELLGAQGLTGDNQVETDTGKQDATQTTEFVKLPDILRFQLKRYKIDRISRKTVKQNDCFEFPETLDVSQLLTGAPTYYLMGVIAHVGDAGDGDYVAHYVAYLRVGGNQDWYRFNDGEVSPVPSEEAIQANYGGGKSKCTAYMLIYVSADKMESVFRPENDGDVLNLVAEFSAGAHTWQVPKGIRASCESFCPTVLPDPLQPRDARVQFSPRQVHSSPLPPIHSPSQEPFDESKLDDSSVYWSMDSSPVVSFRDWRGRRYDELEQRSADQLAHEETMFQFIIRFYKQMHAVLNLSLDRLPHIAQTMEIFRTWYENESPADDRDGAGFCVLLAAFLLMLEPCDIEIPSFQIINAVDSIITDIKSSPSQSLWNFPFVDPLHIMIPGPAVISDMKEAIKEQVAQVPPDVCSVSFQFIAEIFQWNCHLTEEVASQFQTFITNSARSIFEDLLEFPLLFDYPPDQVALALIAILFQRIGFVPPQRHFSELAYQGLTSSPYLDMRVYSRIQNAVAKVESGQQQRLAEDISAAQDHFSDQLFYFDPPPDDESQTRAPTSYAHPSHNSVECVLSKPPTKPTPEDLKSKVRMPHYFLIPPHPYEPGEDPPLVQAVMNCDLRSVVRLLSEKGNVDSVNSRNETGLLLAVLLFNYFWHRQIGPYQFFREIARILVRHSANPWHASNEGVRPQMAAGDYREQWADVPFLTRALPAGLAFQSFCDLQVVEDFEQFDTDSFSVEIPTHSLNSSKHHFDGHPVSFSRCTTTVIADPSTPVILHPTIDLICAWLAQQDFFTCKGRIPRKGKKSLQKESDKVIFHVSCGLCGGHCGELMIKGDVNANVFSIRAQTVCPHFFAARSSGSHGKFTAFTHKPSLSSSDNFPENHPVRVISRTICDARVHPLPSLYNYFAPFRLGRTAGFDYARQAAGTDDLKELLGNLGGHVFIEICRDLKRIPDGVLCYEGGYVETLVWVAKWAPAAFLECFFMEDDCTHGAGRPYVLFIPMAVINNYGVPLGLVLTPTEQAQTYRLFAESLAEVDKNCDVRDKPMLSDGGLGLESFGKTFCSVHYRCFRHILEDLGAKTYVAMLAHRLLFAMSEAQFRESWEQTVSDFRGGVARGVITPNGANIFCRLFGLSPIYPFDVVDEDHFRNQAVWGPRGEYGVGLCSNHVEGFHRPINKATAHEPGTVRRTGKVGNGVFAKVKQFVKEVFSSGWDHICRLKSQAENQSSHALRHGKTDLWSGTECHLDSCAAERRIFAKRYGIEDFPCVHTALSYRKEALPRPPQFLSAIDLDDRTTKISVKLSRHKEWAFDSRCMSGATPIPSFSDLPSDEDKGPDEYTRFIRTLYFGLIRVGASTENLTCELLSAQFTRFQIERNVPPTDMQLRTEFTIDCFVRYKS
jgi:ubiquitin C-terminal hydrolase